MTYWLEYFCEGVAFTLGRVREKIEKLSHGRPRRVSDIQISLTERQMIVIEGIGRAGKITNKEMQTMFKISAQAVHKEIKKLLDQKIVRLVGKGRGAHYKLS